MSKVKDARTRYRIDPVFKRLVDYMTSFLMQADFTPTEMREAAILASIKYSEINPHAFIVPTDRLHKLLDEAYDNEL